MHRGWCVKKLILFARMLSRRPTTIKPVYAARTRAGNRIWYFNQNPRHQGHGQ